MKDNLIQNKSYQFALSIFDIYRILKQKREYSLANQILRSATSIGANVEEAIGGSSKADFVNKLTIALKEARETKYWLRLLQDAKIMDLQSTHYFNEIESIINILYSIIKTMSKN